MARPHKAEQPDTVQPYGWARRAKPLAPLLIAICAVVAYGNSFSVPFFLDDMSSIVDNPVIHDLGGFLSGAGYAFNPRRFVGYLTFALNYRFGGLDVFGYHLVNLVIHIANGLLVYALAGLAIKAASPVNGERGMVNKSPSLLSAGEVPFTVHHSPFTQFVPLFAALLFVVHPVQTQAVTYIVQRLASLATLFYLASVVAYAYGRQKAQGTGLKDEQKKLLPVPGPWSPVPWYFLAVVSGLLAMKTKEMAVTLPLAIILYEFCFYGFSRRKLLILMVPVAMGAVVAAIGIAGSGKPLGELISDVSEMSRETKLISRGEYLLTQFAVVATYLRLLVFPVNQNVDYDYLIFTSLFRLKPFLGLMLHLALVGTALWAWRTAHSGGRDRQPEAGRVDHSSGTLHHSLIAFGILWFYLTLSIESGLIPIKDVIFEHRLYLPSAGFFLAAASAAGMLTRRLPSRALVVAMAGIVMLLTAATVKRNMVWRSTLSIWEDVIAKSPNKLRPYYNAGCEYANLNDMPKAITYFRRSIELKEDQPECHNNLGLALLRVEQVDEAIIHLRRAIELKPSYAMAHYNLGLSYAFKGNTAAALQSVQQAVDLDPANSVLKSQVQVFREYLQSSPNQAP